MLTGRYGSSPAKSEEGATAVEYAIMAALIAVAITAAVAALGRNLADLFLPLVSF